MDKTKAEIEKFKKLEQEAHNGTAETGYYTDEFEYWLEIVKYSFFKDK